jgi:hypothetical protein
MAIFDKPFGQKLREKFMELFGKRPKFSNIHPSDPMFLVSVWPGLTYPHNKPVPRQSSAGCLRRDQISRQRKRAAKGHRMKKRRRLEGPYATW